MKVTYFWSEMGSGFGRSSLPRGLRDEPKERLVYEGGYGGSRTSTPIRVEWVPPPPVPHPPPPGEINISERKEREQRLQLYRNGELTNQSRSALKQNQSKREITFDTQLKTALYQYMNIDLHAIVYTMSSWRRTNARESTLSKQFNLVPRSSQSSGENI